MAELFLNRVLLDPLDRRVQRDLQDCHAMHQRIMQAFPTAPDDSARSSFGVLYRIELTSDRRPVPVILLQASLPGRWDTLPDGYLLRDPGAPNPAVKEIGQRYDRIATGDQFRFRLRANPTRRVHAGRFGGRDRMAGKRVQLFSEGERLAWLDRKGSQHGFRVGHRSLRIGHGDAFGSRQSGSRGTDGDRRTVTFEAVLFDGELEVTDAERFRAALRDGIGSGKAYGFGLLSIAPAEG